MLILYRSEKIPCIHGRNALITLLASWYGVLFFSIFFPGTCFVCMGFLKPQLTLCFPLHSTTCYGPSPGVSQEVEAWMKRWMVVVEPECCRGRIMRRPKREKDWPTTPSGVSILFLWCYHEIQTCSLPYQFRDPEGPEAMLLKASQAYG